MSQFMELGGAGYAVRTQVRPAFVRAFAATLLAFAFLHAYSGMRLTVPTYALPSQNVVLTTHAAPKVSAAGPVATLQPSPHQPIKATPAAITIPSCQTIAYSLPVAIDLSSAAAGLTQQIDAPVVYQIYGNDSATVRAQIAKCAPKMGSGEFTGDTSYTINWQYNYGMSGGTCMLSNAKVGVHINEVLPGWRGSSTTPASFAARWQAFMSALNTHEQGHANLDEAMANTMLSQLQGFTAPSCDSVVGVINAQMQSDLAVLNAQNDQYDLQTNHGVTQGAILP